VNSVAETAISLLPAVSRALLLLLAPTGDQGGVDTGLPSRLPGLSGLCLWPGPIAGNCQSRAQRALAALQRIWALFRILPEENSQTGATVDHLKGEIESREVSFSYNGRDNVLDRLSFLIRSGEHVGLAGHSGIGKTTLLSCPLLLQAYIGEIYFDGRPASGLESRH